MRQKNFDGKSWHSPLIYQNFFGTRNSWNSKGFPYEIFRHWDKKFLTENLDTPPPLIQTFRYQKINATVKDSPTEIFGTVRQKNFDGKSWHSPLIYQNFFGTRNSWNSKGFPYEIFRHWDKKFLTENLDTPPPPFYPNFFDTENNWNTKGFPAYGNFRHCETKNFRRKILIPPSYP